MKKLAFVTGNSNKAREIEQITGLAVEAVSLDVPEIQSLEVAAVARAKAQAAYLQLKKPVVVDDTGMSITALGGLPGAFVGWFVETVGVEGILRMMGETTQRHAKVTTCLGYCDAEGPRVFEGTQEGSISLAPRGTNGFGFDAIFIPQGGHKTNAEMTPEEKNAQSTRAAALSELKAFLETLA